jgi:hypothetical protein
MAAVNATTAKITGSVLAFNAGRNFELAERGTAL